MKTAKKTILALLALVMVLTPMSLVAREVNVKIDGEPIQLESAFVEDGTAFISTELFEILGYDLGLLDESDIVPARLFLEALGYTVEWDNGIVLITRPQLIVISEDEAEALASGFLRNLTIENIITATMMMSIEMQIVHDLAMTVLVSMGDVIDFEIAEHMLVDGYHVFDMPATHTQGTITHRIAISPSGEVAGHFFLTDFDFEPGRAGESAAFSDEAVIIGANTMWQLDGILTMPNSASAENPVPAAVLVHGSGAHNMDSSLFNNRPFFDIANYLSSHGIAVLRYNERSLLHPEALMQIYGVDFSLWEENIEDALLAAEILRADERVSEVFIIGLSLGGMVAPRIAYEGGLDGAVLLAASPRPLFEISYDQNQISIRDALAAGFFTQEEATAHLLMIAELLEEAHIAMETLTRDELRETVVFGLPGIYQLSIIESNPLQFMSASDMPFLILQGDRDWQVTADVDFQIFLDYTQNMANVTAILYENVNHLFMLSQTPYNDLRDYLPTGTVYAQVLRDIVEWILQNAG